MAVPVFEGEKWRRLDALWNVLFERFAVAWDVEEVFKISSIQSSDEGIEPSQFSTAITFKRGTSAQIGEGLTCASCRASLVPRRLVPGGHFWQFGSIASLATETTDGDILVAFWPKHGLRIDFIVPNSQNFPGGACPQTPLHAHLSARNGRTSLK